VTLLERLQAVDDQARRLRLAWYVTLASRGDQSVCKVVDEALAAALEAIERARTTEGRVAFGAAVHRATEGVRRALRAESELLVPATLREFDDDDWEAVAELERLLG